MRRRRRRRRKRRRERKRRGRYIYITNKKIMKCDVWMMIDCDVAEKRMKTR